MRNIFAPAAIWTLPSPHGHRPAMARTSVLLPVPDSPATSTRSPGTISTSASFDDRGAVVERDREVGEAQRRAGSSPRSMRPTPSPCLGALQSVERHHQRGDAAGRRGPVGKPGIVVDQPVEGGLDDDEGRRRLHHLPERHRAVEKLRRAQDDRQHRRDVAAGLRDDRRAHRLNADLAPAAQHLGQCAVEAVALLVLAAEHARCSRRSRAGA